MPKVTMNILGASAVVLALSAITATAQTAQPGSFPAASPPLSGTTLQKLQGLKDQNKVDAIAQWYGWSAAQFEAEVTRFFPAGSKMTMDSDGRIYNEERGVFTIPNVRYPWGTYGHEIAELQSKPDAPKTIYLNFKNAELTGTRLTPTSLPGFSLDEKPASGPGGEHDLSYYDAYNIVEIWRAVADDFAPFDVNVTTVEPPPHKLVRSDANDEEYGTTVHIYSKPGASGAAIKVYVKSFGDTDESVKPILINTSLLGNNRIDITGAISYALGHAMGLRRNASLLPAASVEAYKLDSTDVWAPTMGDYVGRKVKQFSRSVDLAETPALDESEDEIAVLLRNGLSFRSDDFGGDRFKATVLEDGIGGLAMDGILERHLDADVFAINAGVGRVFLAAYPVGDMPPPNANVELTLHNSRSGVALKRANNDEDPSAGLEFDITEPGPYFITVRAAGDGEAISGNSTYGSRGYYRLWAVWNPSGFVEPTASLTASAARIQKNAVVSFNASGSTDDKPVTGLQYRWDFGDGTRRDFYTNSTAEVRYSRAGTYTVTLTVKDSDNQISTARTTVTVTDAPPATSNVLRVQRPWARALPGQNAGAEVMIRITDDAGNPAQGVRVEAIAVAIRNPNEPWPSYTTDAQGIIRVPADVQTGGRIGLSIKSVSKDGHTVQAYQQDTAIWL